MFLDKKAVPSNERMQSTLPNAAPNAGVVQRLDNIGDVSFQNRMHEMADNEVVSKTQKTGNVCPMLIFVSLQILGRGRRIGRV